MTAHSIAGHSYVVKSDHRDGTAKKSQWSITVPAEHAAFERTVTHGWHGQQAGWGLHLLAGKVTKLGESATAHGKVRNLFVAYFVLGAVCHGYPSDTQRSTRELPPPAVLGLWEAQGLLRPQVVRKMARGLPCKP